MAELIKETCEGSGQPSGWSSYTSGESSGSANWDYATSPAPLAGSQSLRITSDGYRLEYYTLADLSAFYAYMMICMTTLVSGKDNFILDVYTSGLSYIFGLARDDATGYLLIDSDIDGEHASTYALSLNTTYHAWLEFHKGGSIQAWINTSPVKPASPAISYTSGMSYDAGIFGLTVATGGGVNIFDNILVADAQIGSYPFSPLPPHFAREQNILLRR